MAGATKLLVAVFLCVISVIACAQNTVRIAVEDGASGRPLPGATVVTTDSSKGSSCDENGIAELRDVASGNASLLVSFVGYRDTLVTVHVPFQGILKVRLSPAQESLDEIIVSSTRTDQHIEDLPLKVEVLGKAEMDEESTLVPGNVASILGDLAVITIQRTNPINGNDAIRLQGLDPQYTLVARDGLPLYGGFSGSLGVLSIPPLDLRQVEIIKGSVSTLYGGGAIAGMINLISREPGAKPEGTLLMNATTLKEKNINSFFSGRISRKTGYTLFAGANLKSAADVNDDGFSEVPEQQNYTLHPRLFFQPGGNTRLNIGLTSTIDNRRTGDMLALKDGRDAQHPFLRKENTFRHVLDLQFNHHYSADHVIAFKTAVSVYRRKLQVPLASSADFSFLATQYSSYSEASDRRLLGKHTIVTGVNLITETLRKAASANAAFDDYDYITVGLFAQDDWEVSNRFTIEGGLRLDHHNVNGYFPLPRIALFYRPTDKVSLRLASGAGYKAPSILSLTDPNPNLVNNGALVNAEHSLGINADINYNTVWSEEVEVSVNQAFYLATITDPLVVITDTLNQVAYMENAPFRSKTLGTDTYAQLTYRGWELYLGYNHTEAYQAHAAEKNPMPFNPKDKFSMTFAYAVEGKWRAGIEASFMANQYVSADVVNYTPGVMYPSHRVPDFWFWAAMAEKQFGFGSIVLNVENLFDARQSRFEHLLSGSLPLPDFKPVWAPLEGRVFNLSVKVSLARRSQR